MDDRIEDVEVTFIGVAGPFEPEETMDVLAHLDGYDVPDAYSKRMSNIAGLDPEHVDGAQYLFADHDPSATRIENEEPNVFMAEYENDRLLFEFVSDYDRVPDFVDPVEYLLSVTDVTILFFNVEFDVAADVTAGTSIENIEGPEEYLQSTTVHPEEGRSEIGLDLQKHHGDRMEDSADAIETRLAETVRAVEKLLP